MTQKEFRNFLGELNFVKSNAGQDVMFGELFMDCWVYFSDDGKEKLTGDDFRYIVGTGEVDIDDFITKCIEANLMRERGDEYVL